MKFIILLLALPLYAQYVSLTNSDKVNVSQINSRPVSRTLSGIPTPPCTSGKDIYVNSTTNKLYFCVGGAYKEVPMFTATQPNRCVRTDVNGNLTVASQDCGTGGSSSDTASNQGSSGVGLFYQKLGTDFQFYKLNTASNKMAVTLDLPNKNVNLDIVEANLTLANLAGNLPIDTRTTNKLPSARVEQPFDTLEIGDGSYRGFIDFCPTSSINCVGFIAPGARATALRFVLPVSDTAGILQVGAASSGEAPMSIASGSSGKAVCWKTTTTLGYCSTQPDSTGACTCN